MVPLFNSDVVENKTREELLLCIVPLCFFVFKEMSEMLNAEVGESIKKDRFASFLDCLETFLYPTKEDGAQFCDRDGYFCIDTWREMMPFNDTLCPLTYTGFLEPKPSYAPISKSFYESRLFRLNADGVQLNKYMRFKLNEFSKKYWGILEKTSTEPDKELKNIVNGLIIAFSCLGLFDYDQKRKVYARSRKNGSPRARRTVPKGVLAEQPQMQGS